jgi:aldehyde dehydrogenase (NAD+)
LVEEDADMNVTAKRIVWGKFLNCGQTCIAPDYLIMTQKTRKLLFTTLVQVIHDFYGDDPKQSPDYSRIVSERHYE